MTTLAMPPHPPHDASPAQAERDERARRTASIVDELQRATSDAARRELVDELIATNVAVARSLAARYRNRGIDVDDLEQVALVGLVKAARRFDPFAGHDFMSYAVPTVRGELRRHFRDSGWMIRVPRSVQQLQSRIRASQHELEALLGRSPRPSEIAVHLGADPDDVVEALAADGCFRPASIDSSAGDQHGGTIADVLGGEDRGFASLEARLVLDSAVGRLTERDRQILRWRFVEELTQREIAGLVGLTQAQVSRTITRLLARLRTDLSEPLSAA
ncbi:sigma-70 family RNA polymerase sigma factor [Nocardioides pinisoli]|uniref:Sigma-70 family RNA polymerase sigma factor n=1 Tax=Nocardioides pinisoli TaxID=2950279 RepID=A0ABT1L3W4_9ACTN|nr:sigma-70 family RNA polymerase sigma factor [Nocardioides pinisoli]MCP3424271.1 sigma-70 family RNA polymerase sigma factor [Nocardioides pinisoli]